jgi:hypothetical protein
VNGQRQDHRRGLRAPIHEVIAEANLHASFSCLRNGGVGLPKQLACRRAAARGRAYRR